MAQFTKENLLSELEARMKKTEEALKNGFAAIRTGKASPALVEGLMIDYYGSQVKLNTIAGINAPEARLLVIQPWDAGAVKAIEKELIFNPVIYAGMAVGEGTGAVMMLQLLKTANAVLEESASFEAAGIQQYERFGK